MIKIVLPGCPLARQRARSNRKTGVHYDAQKKEFDAVKLLFVDAVRREGSYHYPVHAADAPVFVGASFFLPMPKSWSSKKKESMEMEHVLTKPDLDNLLKTILDAGTGITWHDDKQIVQIKTAKYYSHSPRTVLTITDHPALLEDQI